MACEKCAHNITDYGLGFVGSTCNVVNMIQHYEEGFNHWVPRSCPKWGEEARKRERWYPLPSQEWQPKKKAK